ncbi:unnamed protein product [Rotaria sp. Silwood2]|nr:unnamed protein product [Rotaria sp. Silwood2]CAF2775890.1 unnamed protein product [Rotaria sp. Silwood2]CAF3015000.1 unnamed protein product [Rotaria sp. Silwood2]CAF3202002.1 unnamed protein product [Rotaria sp. Silwood2]CAF3926212.1 unnamed protein product [Rotaria sp. Silwood2]
MQYYFSRLFILFLCIMVIVDDSTTALKLRLPSLRITSTFTRTAETIKRKLRVHNNAIEDPSKTMPSKNEL